MYTPTRSSATSSTRTSRATSFAGWTSGSATASAAASMPRRMPTSTSTTTATTSPGRSTRRKPFSPTTSFGAASLHFDIGEHGEMHHNPAKNVLWVAMPPEEVASKMGRKVAEVIELLASAKTKMYAARLKRPTPFVDKTVYVSWNAMCVSAYLQAAQVLGLEDARKFALRSLDRILSEGVERRARTVARHRLCRSKCREAIRSGLLDDYAFTAIACLDAYEVTGAMSYFRFAQKIADEMIGRFADQTSGGFFDTEASLEEKLQLGALSARRKPFQDAPTPAGNPSAAIALLAPARLHQRREVSRQGRRYPGSLRRRGGAVRHLRRNLWHCRDLDVAPAHAGSCGRRRREAERTAEGRARAIPGEQVSGASHRQRSRRAKPAAGSGGDDSQCLGSKTISRWRSCAAVLFAAPLSRVRKNSQRHCGKQSPESPNARRCFVDLTSDAVLTARGSRENVYGPGPSVPAGAKLPRQTRPGTNVLSTPGPEAPPHGQLLPSFPSLDSRPVL